MKNKFVIIWMLILLFSLVLNVYLYFAMNKHKQAWLNQFVTTSEIEKILSAAGGNLSIKNIESVAISLYGKESVKVVDLQNEFTVDGADRMALGVNETLIFFKDNIYYGSKANLSNH